MVNVESFSNDGTDNFNEFSCGECGYYYSSIENAKICCSKKIEQNLELHEDDFVTKEKTHGD